VGEGRWYHVQLGDEKLVMFYEDIQKQGSASIDQVTSGAA
jgi:hypothetical protein